MRMICSEHRQVVDGVKDYKVSTILPKWFSVVSKFFFAKSKVDIKFPINLTV